MVTGGYWYYQYIIIKNIIINDVFNAHPRQCSAFYVGNECNASTVELLIHCQEVITVKPHYIIQHSVKPENIYDVGLGGCLIMECLIPYSTTVTVHH